MQSIKDILTNSEVKPSAQSWDKLSNKLDLVMPQAGAPAQTPAPTGTSHLLGTLGAKIAAVVVGAATVAAVVTTVVLNARKDRQQTQEPAPVEQTAPVVDTLTVAQEQVAPVSHATVVESVIVSEAKNEALMSEPAKEISTPQVVMPAPVRAQSSAPAPNPTPAMVSLPTEQKPAASQNVPQQKPVSVARTVQQDPVVQALPEDAVDWAPPVKIEIPNVFTPNGDGYNDYFVIVGLENCTVRELVVFNRSGQKVFQTNSYENSWNGGDCPDGVYSYRFRYAGFNGIEQTMSGTVHIIRR